MPPFDLMMNKQYFKIFPIGEIIYEDNRIILKIFDKYKSGLMGLEDFSHIKLFWWFDRNDNEDFSNSRPNRGRLKAHPPIADGLEVGVFSSRSPFRPNLIGTTICKIVNINLQTGIIQIDKTQAFDKTPIIDIKPYIPRLDSIENPQIAGWLKEK